MTEIQLVDVTAAYRDHIALRDLTLTARDGGLTAILGPSGCGKSTTVRVIAGFHRAAGGTVRLGDAVVDGPGVFVPPERRHVGVVPQNVALFPHLDVAGNVGYGLRRWGRYDRERVTELLDMIGLPDAGAQPVHRLSGGMQQRVAVARALAPRPLAVMLDEPFTALDQGLREAVRADVLAALRANGTTAVLVTHDQEEALSVADEVVLMRDGRVVQHGAPTQLYQQPASLWAARFLGDLVELPVIADGSDRVSTPLGELRVASRARDGEVSGGDQVAVVRPEELVGDELGVPGLVTDVVFFGHDAMVEVLLPDGGAGVPVSWRTSGTDVPRPGDTVRLRATGAARVFHG